MQDACTKEHGKPFKSVKLKSIVHERCKTLTMNTASATVRSMVYNFDYKMDPQSDNTDVDPLLVVQSIKRGECCRVVAGWHEGVCGSRT